MVRNYTREKYLEIVEKIRETVPDIEIAADFIVGFPGETEEEFEETLDLLRLVRFQNAFVFKYSPRPGTPSAGRFEDDIPLDVKKERNQRLLAAQEEVSRELHESLHGHVVEVLVEGPSKRDASNLTGRTRSRRIVCFKGDDRLTGHLIDVRITDSTPLTLFAEVL